MYLDENLHATGGGEGPFCCACKGLIQKGQHSMRVVFDSDPQGAKGLTGAYHAACAKPFASMAQAINMMSRFGR